MIKLSIIDITSKDFETIRPLDLDSGGITELKLKMDLYEPYQLKATINQNSGQIFKKLINDPETGLKLETKYYTFIFIKDDQKAKTFGEYSLTFLSYSTMLSYSYPDLANEVINDNISNILNNLDNDFVFEVIGNDFEKNFNTGQKSNLDILKEIASGSASWREVGLVDINNTKKTKIQVGNFSGQKVNNRHRAYRPVVDDPSNLDDIIINDIKVNFNGRLTTHVNIIGNTGSGSSKNNIITFNKNDLNASYIDPRFPLVKIQSPFSNKEKIFVEDSRAAASLKQNYYATEVTRLTSSSQELGGNSIDKEKAKKEMYRKAIDILQSNSSESYPTFDVTMKRVILPGEKINYKYKETVDDITLFNFDKDELLRDLEFDLLKIHQTA